MPWKNLESEKGLDAIIAASVMRPQLIFKHSTRCSISFGAKNRLDDKLEKLAEKFDVHYLDLLRYREVSDKIASQLGLEHESPQVIIVEEGAAVFHLNHHTISPDKLLGYN